MPAPGVVSKVLICWHVDIGATQANRNVGRHLVGAAYQRQAVTAVEVAVILQVVVGIGLKKLDCVGPSGGNERGGLSIWIWHVRQDDRPTLFVAAIRPFRQSSFK